MSHEIGSSLWYREQVDNMEKMEFEKEVAYRHELLETCNNRIKFKLSEGMIVRIQAFKDWYDIKGRKYKGVIERIDHWTGLPHHWFVELRQGNRLLNFSAISIGEIEILAEKQEPRREDDMILHSKFIYDKDNHKFYH